MYFETRSAGDVAQKEGLNDMEPAQNFQTRLSQKMKIIYSCIVLFLVAVTAGSGQQPQEIDIGKMGPQAGQKIADFGLQDQNGKVWTRDALMGPNGLMLVFSRSADWCPYCKTQLVELQSRLPELRRKGDCAGGDNLRFANDPG
jgi:cytochrome oxidase Cu insertion factor (SCO1/SenC/PrrC family)